MFGEIKRYQEFFYINLLDVISKRNNVDGCLKLIGSGFIIFDYVIS